MSAWRQAGLNYVHYSNVAAKALRKALKPDLRAEAQRRNDTSIKFTKWSDGKPADKHMDPTKPKRPST